MSQLINIDELELDAIAMDDFSIQDLSLDDSAMDGVVFDDHQAYVRRRPRKTFWQRNSQYLIGGGFLLGFGLLIMAGLMMQWSVKRDVVSEGELRTSMPSDIYDASAVCEEKMEERIGDRLLRKYMDERSSREDASIYRIYYKADVGTLTEYDEVMVYCYVDRWRYELSYFKELNPNIRNISTSDLQFFK